MRSGWILAAALAASSASAGEYAGEYAKIAGEHMGRSEIAAILCPGVKLNTGRRDEILSLYAGPDITRLQISRSRAAERRKAEAAKGSDAKKRVCRALLDAYGPKGLVIQGYLYLDGEDPQVLRLA